MNNFSGDFCDDFISVQDTLHGTIQHIKRLGSKKPLCGTDFFTLHGAIGFSGKKTPLTCSKCYNAYQNAECTNEWCIADRCACRK